MRNFYVYTLKDPKTGLDFYIGKGSGNRATDHLRESRIENANNRHKANKIRKIQRHSGSVRVRYIATGLKEQQAFRMEKALISEVGLDNLTNIKCGGEGATLSEDTKQKISKSLTGNPISEECREKISEALTGRSVSDETRKKLSKAHTGKSRSEETKRKLSEAHAGKEVSREQKEFLATLAKTLAREEAAECKWLSTYTRISYEEIGSRYGVKASTVSSIRNGYSWLGVNAKRPDFYDGEKLSARKDLSERRLRASKIRWLAENAEIDDCEIADQFDISRASVTYIRQGKTWSDVAAREPSPELLRALDVDLVSCTT